MFVFENNGAGYQFQLKYTLLLYKYHKNSYKISEMSESGFFLSRSHIGRDSGFSSKIGRNSTWSGWLDSLITWYTIVPLICYFKMWTQCYSVLSHRLISVATCVIGCFDVFYALWLTEKIRQRFSTNQKKIKLLRTNRISFLAVFPPLRNWFHNNITSRHFATWLGSGRLQRKWWYLYFPSPRSPLPTVKWCTDWD